jgi:spermidine synthase
VLTGSIWDALALPALILGTGGRREPESALLLGLGGGSTARILRACRPELDIVGVDQSPEVIQVARRELGLAELEVDVVIDDAFAYLRRTRRRFDLVIEDIFLDDTGNALRKPGWLPAPALDVAIRRLSDGGVLVCNTIDDTDGYAAVLKDVFPYLVQIQAHDCHNRVLAGSHHRLRARDLVRRLARHRVMRGAARSLRCTQLRA